MGDFVLCSLVYKYIYRIGQHREESHLNVLRTVSNSKKEGEDNKQYLIYKRKMCST